MEGICSTGNKFFTFKLDKDGKNLLDFIVSLVCVSSLKRNIPHLKRDSDSKKPLVVYKQGFFWKIVAKYFMYIYSLLLSAPIFTAIIVVHWERLETWMGRCCRITQESEFKTNFHFYSKYLAIHCSYVAVSCQMSQDWWQNAIAAFWKWLLYVRNT